MNSINLKAVERVTLLRFLFGMHPANIGKGYGDVPRGCAAVMTHFFQASHRSLAYQFIVNAPLLCPLFSIFR